MSQPLVSVVMPAYNHRPFVGAAVQSVLAQTHTNLELIVVDDASTDGTGDVLQAIDDPRLRLFSHTANQGAHATLNEALGYARGDFIAIINSDDIFDPRRIEACLLRLREEGADLVGSDIALMDADGSQIVQHWWLDAYDALKAAWRNTGDWVAALLEGNVFMTTSNFFFSRALNEELGGFRDYRYVHDYEWLLRALARGKKLAWVDAPLLRYRLHESNTIAERPLAANLECAAMIREMLPDLLGETDLSRQRLARLASQWARLDRYVGEIHATIRHEALVAKEAELFKLIADRDRWIAERDGWIAERDRWVADRDCRIAERDQWIAERDQWIAERDGWIAERDQRIGDYQREVATCHEAYRRLQESASFRIGRAVTAPARWLRSIARRTGGEP